MSDGSDGGGSWLGYVVNGSLIVLAGATVAFTGLAFLARRRLKPKRKWTSSKTLDELTIVVTGGNSGIGAATVMDLTRRKANVIIASRTASSSLDLISGIQQTHPDSNVSYRHLDLSCLKSTKEFVDTLDVSNVDILVNNAGVWGSPVPLSPDGFEQTFATNYLGPFYLTKLLLQKFDVQRVINVSSGLHARGRIDPSDLDALLSPPAETPDKNVYRAMYSTSKLAQIYHTRQLAIEHPETTCVALHPGLVYSNLARYVKPQNFLLGYLAKLLPLVIRTPEEGAMTTVYCCVESDLQSGAYYGDCEREELKKVATDTETQQKLWDFTESLLAKAVGKF